MCILTMNILLKPKYYMLKVTHEQLQWYLVFGDEEGIFLPNDQLFWDGRVPPNYNMISNLCVFVMMGMKEHVEVKILHIQSPMHKWTDHSVNISKGYSLPRDYIGKPKGPQQYFSPISWVLQVFTSLKHSTFFELLEL